MILQESGEMYLETILQLSETMPTVRSIDVSDKMGYSKPSVSRAVGILKSNGYLEMDKDGALRLTESGREIAMKIYTRHRILSSFLVKLGVEPETADSDACRIEHVISDETFEKISEFIKKYFFKKNS